MSISSRWLKVAVFVVLYGVLMGSVIRRGDSIRPYDLMEKRVRQNQYGAVIMDAKGNKINYTRELLMAQKAQWEIIHTGGIDFIQKPYSFVDLLQSVKKSLQSILVK